MTTNCRAGFVSDIYKVYNNNLPEVSFSLTGNRHIANKVLMHRGITFKHTSTADESAIIENR